MSRGCCVIVALLTLLLAARCAPPPPRVAPAPPPADLVVLVPDPEDARVGSATVTATGGGAVELSHANEGTRIVQGQAPTPPAPVAAGDVQRIFGDAIAARPPAPRRFLLSFETGSDTLTPDSQALVSEILDVVRSRPAPEVTVIGHTDTTGEAAANIQLGMRRATLIRDMLVSIGLDAAKIEVASHGEADLLVQTPDSTAEARNRRVEVTVR